jgi:hypothetical protein
MILTNIVLYPFNRLKSLYKYLFGNRSKIPIIDYPTALKNLVIERSYETTDNVEKLQLYSVLSHVKPIDVDKTHEYIKDLLSNEPKHLETLGIDTVDLEGVFVTCKDHTFLYYLQNIYRNIKTNYLSPINEDVLTIINTYLMQIGIINPTLPQDYYDCCIPLILYPSLSSRSIPGPSTSGTLVVNSDPTDFDPNIYHHSPMVSSARPLHYPQHPHLDNKTPHLPTLPGNIVSIPLGSNTENPALAQDTSLIAKSAYKPHIGLQFKASQDPTIEQPKASALPVLDDKSNNGAHIIEMKTKVNAIVSDDKSTITPLIPHRPHDAQISEITQPMVNYLLDVQTTSKQDEDVVKVDLKLPETTSEGISRTRNLTNLSKLNHEEIQVKNPKILRRSNSLKK